METSQSSKFRRAVNPIHAMLKMIGRNLVRAEASQQTKQVQGRDESHNR